MNISISISCSNRKPSSNREMSSESLWWKRKKKPREKMPKHLRVDSQYKMMLFFMKAKVRSCTSLQLTKTSNKHYSYSLLQKWRLTTFDLRKSFYLFIKIMTKTYRSRHKKSVYGLYMYIHVSSYIDVYYFSYLSI